MPLIVADVTWFDEHFVSFDEALENVSAQRRQHALAYCFPQDQKRSVLSSVLLDMLLRRHGLCERDMAYVEGDNGKPFFKDVVDFHFSLSHSGDAAAVMLARKPVGVDIEYLPAFPKDMMEPDRWTEMEAVGKLLGCGVGCYVDNGVFDMPDDVETAHIDLGDYLLCVAWKNGA